ncbi:catalase [Sphingobacterium corticibacterium]|uniref:Catalase n=1 Tax=Sphingobacterium corticibacterium TaxID=2484746 RepID=A0A4Q6XYZ3_9SPHI|nr:catalase [Sphingobacterium corticibacterium]RZF62604.1 catalase [Sphingobacterium corticibacterium]
MANGHKNKVGDLGKNTVASEGKPMTTDQGVKINDDANSLKAGERGASLLEDFILREKITHFDHERIPERIVHARGSGAHGYFELYEDMRKYTRARIFTDTENRTPVFVRFSTVAGSKGSGDLARDIRGFAVKFYTQEGVFDLVGNNTPVFFIQDAMKFPDIIHSVKPEPDWEIPQAASAHDTFYDFISLATESLHNHMWAMSDRGIPRSYRMMEGFGIHTFRLVNEQGESHFVKFHWKPKLGVHSVTWDEAVKINGADPDFHRRDLWEAIEAGHFPEWELGLQIIPAEDEHKYEFDLLDATKFVPEELVPVKIIGKMTLDRNPDNFFAETEQVAFHPGHIVPGIDFTNDPLLQGRLFSYTDTQLSRLGGPNFREIPINRAVNEVHNNHRDAQMRMTINQGKAAYFPNTIGGGCPHLAKMAEGGFTSFEERIDGKKIRDRSASFSDHFSQPGLFFRSLAEWEQTHLINAYVFELGKCNRDAIKERMLWLLSQIDDRLATAVASKLGMQIPMDIERPINQNIGADADPHKHEPSAVKHYLEKSESLSQEPLRTTIIEGRKIAVLAADGFDMAALQKMKAYLEELKHANFQLIAPHGGTIRCTENMEHRVDASLMTTESVLFDALYIPGGIQSIQALKSEGKVFKFIHEMLKHCKVIAFDGEAEELFKLSAAKDFVHDEAILLNGSPEHFAGALAKHRNWQRESHTLHIAV